MKKYKGRIVDVYPGRGGIQYLIQGIKKDQQPFYDQNSIGGHGTYLGADETYPVIYAKVSVYDLDNHALKIDIREVVFNHYEWLRVSEKRISELKSKLVGKKVTVIETDEEYRIENIESLL